MSNSNSPSRHISTLRKEKDTPNFMDTELLMTGNKAMLNRAHYLDTHNDHTASRSFGASPKSGNSRVSSKPGTRTNTRG